MKTESVFLWLIIGIGLFITACESGEVRKEEDSLVRDEILKIEGIVDSLVIHGHPDPDGYINALRPDGGETGFSYLFRKYMTGLHYYNEYKKDSDTANQYADSTLQLFETEEAIEANRLYYLNAVLLKTDVLRMKKLYGTSIQYLLNVWQMIDNAQTPCVASQYLGKLASISYLQENYSGSIDYFNQAWDASKMCEEKKDFTYFKAKYQYYQNIAANYSSLENPDSVLHYSKLSLDLLENDLKGVAVDESEKHFAELARGVALGNMAHEMDKTGDVALAEELWKESIGINIQPGFANEHAQLMRLHMAEMYIQSNRMEEAKVSLDTVKTWLNSNSSETGERRWLRAYGRWLENEGDYRQAYDIYRQYVEMENSIYESKTDLATLDLNNQIQLLENQYNLERFEAESRLRNAYLILILVVSVMALAILFLVWKNWKESQRSVSRLFVLNNAIRKKNLQLEERTRAISKIMNIVSHDLRSPLSGVREISAVMKGDQTLGKEHRKWAGLIHSATNQSLKLMKEILNFNLHKTGNNGFEQIPVLKKSVSVHSFLQNCVDLLQLKANEKNQTIHLQCPAKLNAYVDKDKMTRVINNVIGNAIKFSPRNTSIEVKAKKKPSSMLISITDYGIGIPEQKIDEIFDIHSHSSKRRGTDNEESHGLGLSISKEIVEAHGGAIWLESQELAGTTFFIELPINSSKNVKALNPRYDKDSSS